MFLANIIVSSLAISQFVFLTALFLRHHQNLVGKFAVGFCICAIAYLLDEALNIPDSSLLDFLFGQLSILAPFLLWMTASNLFVDERNKHSIAWFVLIGCYLLDTYRAVTYPDAIELAGDPVLYFSLRFVPQLVLLCFPLHAIYLAIRGYKTDLLEERRKFRIAFVAGLGVVVGFIVLGNLLNDLLLGADENSSQIFSTITSAILFIILLCFNLSSIQSSQSMLRLVSEDGSNQAELPENKGEEVGQQYVEAIEKAMTIEQLYTEPGLTISDLAKHLDIMEYRVRHAINKAMEFKNFNQFLNNYRIEAAAELLRTTRLPVSRIAMDVGYSSLSVFNRAFKERMAVTPSDFRKKTT